MGRNVMTSMMPVGGQMKTMVVISVGLLAFAR